MTDELIYIFSVRAGVWVFLYTVHYINTST